VAVAALSARFRRAIPDPLRCGPGSLHCSGIHRLQCGKKVSKDPLPKSKTDTKLTWDVDLENSKRQKTERVRKEKEEQEAVEMVEAMVMPKITIAADLENLHPLIATGLCKFPSNTHLDTNEKRIMMPT
jgi:hypothetical protein